MKPHRQVELLDEATTLVEELKDLPIYRAGAEGGSPEVKGVPASSLGNALGFLQRERDLARFGSFVAGMDQLDFMVGQNQENPLGHHRALQGSLEPWLEETALPVEEVIYVLAWVRRLLPKDSEKVVAVKSARAPRHRALPGREEMSESRMPKSGKGNQMGAALLEALKAKEKKSE